MTMMKALIPSTILTLIVAAVVGSSGSGSGYLNLQHADVGGFMFWWSWPFFMTTMALNSLLVLRIRQANA